MIATNWPRRAQCAAFKLEGLCRSDMDVSTVSELVDKLRSLGDNDWPSIQDLENLVDYIERLQKKAERPWWKRLFGIK